MEIVRVDRAVTTYAVAVLCSAVMTIGCSRSSSAPRAANATVATADPALWGDVKPVVSVKELMKYMLDPVADNIFNAVGTTLTKQGMVDIVPRTDED